MIKESYYYYYNNRHVSTVADDRLRDAECRDSRVINKDRRSVQSSSLSNGPITIAIRARFDYDSTAIRLRFEYDTTSYEELCAFEQ